MTSLALGLILLVRTYDGFGVPQAELDAARHVAGAIMQHAGIGVDWLACPTASAVWLPAPPCASVPGRNEIIVRIADGVRASVADDRVLGNAHLDLHAAGGTLVTLYADRINALAARAGVDSGTVLGRAMAHEIGHLLLGHAVHRDRGLMRGYWTETTLQSRVFADWVFSRADARAIVRKLWGRVGLDEPENEPARPAQN